MDYNDVQGSNNFQIFMNLLKASVGTGILSLPYAFKNSGLILGIFGIFFVALLCGHCSYLLVKCNNKLHKKYNTDNKLSYSDVVEQSLKINSWNKTGTFFKHFINILIFISSYGSCCIYIIIMNTNMLQILTNYNIMSDINSTNLLYLSIFIIMFILICIPNLKILSYISIISNILIICSIIILIYYSCIDIDISNIKYISNPYNYSKFFLISIFAMQSITSIMPIQNSMKYPLKMLNIIIIVYILLFFIYLIIGVFGYIKYNIYTLDDVMLNLPTNDIIAQIGKLCISLSVLGSFAIQFYVCYNVFGFLTKKIYLIIICKYILIFSMFIIVYYVTSMTIFIDIVCSICLSILGFILPVYTEMLLYDMNIFKIIKNHLIIFFGIYILSFGITNTIYQNFILK